MSDKKMLIIYGTETGNSELLAMDAEKLANDLEFEYSTNSPTMMIEGMVVAGK